jgi:integrase
MSPWGIAFVVERTTQKAFGKNAPGRPSPHAFRRGWATSLVRSNTAPNLVMRLAGWKSRAMIDLYTAAASSEMAIADYQDNGRSPVDRAE